MWRSLEAFSNEKKKLWTSLRTNLTEKRGKAWNVAAAAAAASTMPCAYTWRLHRAHAAEVYPPPFVIATQKYQINGPYVYCSLDTGVACAQHIQPPTHTWVSAWHQCTLTSAHVPKGM